MKLNDNFFVRGCLLVLLLIGFGSAAMAQRTVTGTVTDGDNGDPLIGASVLVTGTSTGTVTDFDGNFTLNVPANAESLTFSYTGYATQVIVLDGQSTVNVGLTSGELLDEVVVIGYGTVTKEEVTSAVTSVEAKDFNAGNINDAAQLIQGKVAGLNISRVGGNPNGGSAIRLRGISSFGANNSPLVIIDGVANADLNLIDPNDIESINVLKDGSAAAIYGIQASAGVIIVTTKSGLAGDPQIDYRGYVAFDEVARRPNIASTDEYLGFVEQVVGADARARNDFGGETDWIDEVTRTAVSHVHNLSYAGGGNGTTYRAAVNYRNIQGIGFKKDGFQQINGRLNLTQKAFNDRVTFTVDLTANDRETEFFAEPAFRYAVTFNPAAPVRVTDPGADFSGGRDDVFDRGQNIYGGFFENENFDYNNPVAIVETTTNEGEISKTLANFGASIKIIDGLNLKANYSRQREKATYGFFGTRESRFNGAANGAENRRGNASRSAVDNTNDLFEVTATYKTDFGSTDMELLGGYSWQEFVNQGFSAGGNGLPSNAFGFNNLGTILAFNDGQGGVSSYKTLSRVIGIFGRARFSFADGTYNVMASVRRDGTSRNGPENRWDVFPAVSASADLVKALDISGADQLKLRVGYGITGSIPANPYDYLQRYSIGGQFPIGGAWTPATGPNGNFNDALRFERKGEFNAGVDFAFADYRLTGTIDYYVRNTTDLLFSAQVPTPSFAFGQVFANLNNADLINSGVELTLSYLFDAGGSFSYTPTLTFSTYSNRLEDNGATPDFNFGSGGEVRWESSSPGAPGQNGDPIARTAIGRDLGELWALDVDLEASRREGTWVYIDQDGDGNITTEDKVLAGNGLPDFSLNLQNEFRFGDLDFSFFLRGDFGHDLANLPNNFYGTLGNLQSRSIDNVIVHDNFEAGIVGIPRFSTQYVEDGSFLALDNAQLGYTLRLPEGSGFRTIRPYIAGQNLFYITNYSGVDPNVRYADGGNPLVNGIDRRNTYFRTRTVTVGVNVGF